MMYLILKILLALKMAPKDKDLQDIYNYVFEDAMKYTDEFNIQMVAATYMAIAMRIYKTLLTKEEYKEMVKVVEGSNIKDPKKTVH